MTPSYRPLTAALLLSALACSSEPPDEQVGTAGSGGASVGGSAGSGGRAGSTTRDCPEGPGRETQTEPVYVGVVSGQLVDEQGEPTSAGLVQICGKNLCINARVGESGLLAEAVDDDFDAPACKFGDGKEWGKLAVPLGPGSTELGTLVAVRLPPFEDGSELVPGTAVTSGDVTLTLASDAAVEFDTLAYENEAELVLRAARLPDEALAQLGQDFAVAYALSPVETRVCPSPALSLENGLGLEPGAKLELYVLGLDVLESFAPYGGWQKVGEGEVSQDGAALEFPEGPPLLTAIGVRVKP